jgi:hypothetical protein
MKRIIIVFCCLLTVAALKASSWRTVTITVSNPTDEQRQELVEVDANMVYHKLGISKGKPFRVINALHQEVAYQLTYDGKLLLDVSVRPNGTARFTVLPGQPRPVMPVVYGRQYPERVDDIAWENDRGAYRLYGPALQRNGERAFGNDVWVKNTPDLVVEHRYELELSHHAEIVALRKAGNTAAADSLEELTTYHFDHGYGLDCYKVGPSLGCGAPALLDNNKIVFPYSYTQYEILDNGPLRFTVSLTYETKDYHGDQLTEHRLLSLDKGSNFNKQTVWYEGATKPIDVASGVVIHNEDTTSMAMAGPMVIYADPTDNPAGQNFQIYVGVVIPQADVETLFVPNEGDANGIHGHALVVRRGVQPGERVTYYWGSAWSKYDCHSYAEWLMRTTSLMTHLEKPLEVGID